MNELPTQSVPQDKLARLDELFRASRAAQLEYERKRRALSDEMSSLRLQLRGSMDEQSPAASA